ncbi:hypothetical protein ACJX0J_038847 [Zea mays]
MCNSELTKTQQIKIYPYTKNNHINYIVQIMPKSKLYMPYLILISSTSDIYIHNIIDMKNKYLPIRNHELIPLHMLYFDIHDDYSLQLIYYLFSNFHFGSTMLIFACEFDFKYILLYYSSLTLTIIKY